MAVTATISCAPGDNTGSGDGTHPGSWNHTREVRGDTTFVHTISGSVWGPLPPLEPDLVIGLADGPEEYLFGGRGMIHAVDHEERIWIWDLQYRQLRTYHPDGTFDRIIARSGEGPDEIHSVRLDELIALPDGRLRVIDRGAPAVIDFNPEGAVVNRYRWAALAFGEGTTTLGNWNASRDGTMYRLVAEMQFASPEYALEQPLHLEAHRPEQGRVDTIPLPASPPVRRNPDREAGVGQNLDLWQAGPDGIIVRADVERQVIDVFHPDGRRTSISREWERQPFTAAERARAEERGSPVRNEYRPAFSSIRVGVLSDVIWVVRPALQDELADSFVLELRETDPLDREWELGTIFGICDVFRLDGTYLGALTNVLHENGALQGACYPHAFMHDGKVWLPRQGEDGVLQLHRYSVGPG